jgi:hypothetical protein
MQASVALAGARCYAQTVFSGNIQGVITDPSGAAVPVLRRDRSCGEDLMPFLIVDNPMLSDPLTPGSSPPRESV